ncbi:hypothetical protein ACGFJ7_35335 [Actinoplanes sp. NPDC048988]|uniref:hypothetical protein n=1 Tax=Actinoplanes sp. NPDC048988 TaxID=3363901 RepID=UPI0037175B99
MSAMPPELARHEPATAPDDERLVDIVLRWIAEAPHRGPVVAQWAQYAAAASARLHPNGDQQRQRATLADAAVRAGILPLFDSTSRVAAAVAARITDTGRSSADAVSMLDHLHAYFALHTHGMCPLAHQGVRHTSIPAEHGQGPKPALLTTVVVGVAMAGACGRDDLAGRLLEVRAEHLDVLDAPGRALFAALALDLTDRISGPHRGVCTQTRRRALDRHQFSALLHGEPPSGHRAPAPSDTAPPTADVGAAETRWEVDLDAVWYGLSAYTEALHNRQRLSATPASSGVWLVCDTCRLALRIGSSVVHSALGTLTAPIIAAGQPAWLQADISRATWRMLGEHPNHDLRVLTDISPAWRKYAFTPTDLIASAGTDPKPDIALADYLTDWPGPLTSTDFAGATAAQPQEPVDGAVSLVCLPCRLDLALGRSTGQPGAAVIIGGRPAADQAVATTAVFRMLTEHAGHDLAVFNNAGPWDQYVDYGEWGFSIECGDDRRPPNLGDITHRQYIEGWPEAPTRQHYRGADPVETPAWPGRSSGAPW